MLYASFGAKGTAWLSDRRPWEQLAREIYRAFHAHQLYQYAISVKWCKAPKSSVPDARERV